MAQKDNPLRLSERAQKSLVGYVRYVLEEHRKRNDFIDKMTQIDVAYACFQEDQAEEPGVDSSAGSVPCGTLKDITAPIVVSQVDTYVGYLADIYCSGYPMFPVASSPSKRKQAEQLQSIIDTHAVIGGYPRELIKFFRNCMKYNLGAIEQIWAPIDRYSSIDNYREPTAAARAEKKTEHYNALRTLDAYNTILDPRLEDMASTPTDAEFAGDVRLFSRIKLSRHLAYLAGSGYGYNTTQALHTAIGKESGTAAAPFTGIYYREKPQISSYITQRSFRDYFDFDWSRWMDNMPQRAGRPIRGMYEIAKIYARIIPSEHGMYVPNADYPQIYKLEVVNAEKLICAQRIISAYDLLPVFIGQPFEDGFGEQTRSLGEMQIDYQRTVSKLVNIRIFSARRAISDRAVYDPKMIDPDDVNSSSPTAKIPIKPNAKLGGKGLEDAYKAIPFEHNGTEGVIGDASIVMGWAGKSSGINKPQEGEFQKGNKSVQEWTDTMSGSDNRLRLPAMVLEHQVFGPIKENIKLNIFQNGPTGIFHNMKRGDSVEISEADMAELRKTVLFFKVADGLVPISKIVAMGALKEGMILIGNSPVLQAAYGASLPPLFAHIMQLQGVQDFDEYSPTTAQAQANIATANAAGAATPNAGATPVGNTNVPAQSA